MNRREFITLLGGAAAAWPLACAAQQPGKTPRVGYIRAGTPNNDPFREVQILSSYGAYYNEVRTHLALDKDAPLDRAVQRTGAIVAIPILSGLHHHYVRI